MGSGWKYILIYLSKEKKGCVIKEAVTNKKDRHTSTSILGQFYDKIDGLVSWLVA